MSPTRRDDQDAAMAEARHVLREPWDAVSGRGKSVKIESDILHGDAAQRLLGASRGNRMVCVGHKGVHDCAGTPRHHRKPGSGERLLHNGGRSASTDAIALSFSVVNRRS